MRPSSHAFHEVREPSQRVQRTDAEPQALWLRPGVAWGAHWILSSAPTLSFLSSLNLMNYYLGYLNTLGLGFPTTDGTAPVSTDHLPTHNVGGITCPSLVALRAVPTEVRVPASKQPAAKYGQFAPDTIQIALVSDASPRLLPEESRGQT